MPVKRGEDGLTDFERRFCAEYLVDFNGTDAYVRASLKKVKRTTAASNAHRLLGRKDIQEHMKGKAEELTEKAELSAADTLNKLRSMLMFDVRDLFDSAGDPIPLHELDDDTATAISGLEVLEQYEGVGDNRKFIGYLKKYKLIDRVSVLDKALKYHGLFERDNRQRTDPMTELLKEIYGSGSAGARLPVKG